jgi:hypothetical protein
VDHVVAVAHGGKTDEDNLVTACRDCNFGKSGKLLEQVLWKPPSPPQFVPGSPFLTWLLAQVGRDDPVGDLAGDIKRSQLDGPVQSYRELAMRLRKKTSYDDIHSAAWHAWREWLRGKPTRATAITIADNLRVEKEERAALEAEFKAERAGRKSGSG